ncbi:12925_t:CDS:2 [Cetraspora pellucida]|uniref:12925_t:CDS:1 n=1 Tax=Cetraspora pellucida TaxID=1433469 RepID=A0A9N8ZW69_9GLOM|nr:12925_t:CDS:2 [Cetraspora pellucida]
MISSNIEQNSSIQDSRNAKLPFYCIILTLLAVIGGFENGFNTGITNIPEQTIKNCSNGYNHVQGAGVPDCLPMGNLLWGLAVGSHSMGAIFGGLSAGRLQTMFGRKNALIYNSFTWIIGGVLLGASVNPVMFICGRTITGIGAGIGSVVIPTYLGEISTIKSRGLIGSVYQASVCAGIVITQLVGLPLSFVPGWRILLTLTSVIAIFQLVLMPIIGVESPRYLISQNKFDEAKVTLQKLRKGYNIDLEFEEIIQGQSVNQINAINDDNTEKGEKHIQSSLADTDNQLRIKKSASFKELLQDSYCHKMLFVCVGTHVVQQLCGIQVIVFYSTAIFLNVMDRVGRRPLLLTSEIGVTISCLLIECNGNIHNSGHSGARITIPNIQYGIVIPTRFVSLIGPICLGTNWTLNFLASFIFPVMKEALKEYTFLVFGAITFCFVILTWIFVPETKGRSIEEITSGKQIANK